LSLTQTIFDLIDMRSFSNLWYWIALAVTWSSASHWVLGVPYDLILRARRKGGGSAQDMRDLLRINITRMQLIVRDGGLVLTVFVSFVLSTMAILGFGYDLEFFQAVVLILGPLTLVGIMSLRAARGLSSLLQDDTTGTELLVRRLLRHRIKVQLLGVLSITLTAFWGMFQNFNISVLGS